MAIVEARDLRKVFGRTVALEGLDLTVEEGSILGLVGPNGAGKSTAINALLGLIDYVGSLRVLGADPRAERHRLMRDAAFIGDVAVLPRWLRVSQALDYLEGVHPRFDRARAETLLDRTDIDRRSTVRQLSRGMTVQLHLALALAIDARLLVLDEPTLGLNASYRKQFYETLLTDYLDRRRTVVLATHQVEEIQDLVTDVAVLRRGCLVLAASLEEIASRYIELMPRPEHIAVARALGPIHERQVFGRWTMLFDGEGRPDLAELGDVRTPGVADVLEALSENGTPETAGAAS